MKKIYLLIFYTAFAGLVMAQYTWTNMNPFGGSAVSTPAHFVINGNAFIIGGVLNFSPYTLTNAVWEYNPANDTWTQKSNFPYIVDAASSFVINDTGYVVGGDSAAGGGFLSTTYAYNPVTDTWTQKANFPDNGLGRAAQFVINGIAYITCGTRSYAGSPSAITYAYNPALDSWSYKANFPGALINDPVGFSIDSFGYVGCGGPGTGTLYNTFYKYDPSQDAWSTIDTLPGFPRQAPQAFILNDKAYVGGGAINVNGTYTCVGDVYEYDPSTNIWTPMPGLPGLPRLSSAAFSIGNNGYFVAGYTDYYATPLQTVSRFTSCDNLPASLPAIVNSSHGMKLFPNPASDEINVKWDGDINSNLQYQVISADGKIINSSSVVSKDFSFSTKNLADGIYFINVKDDQASYAVEKFEVLH